MKSVGEIAGAILGARLKGSPDVLVSGAAHDSREVKPGFLFAVLSGAKTDGRLYVEDAIKAGATALLVDREMDVEIPQIVVDDARGSLGEAAAACLDYPTDRLKVAAITGTNGKTTTAYLVEAALLFQCVKPGVMSTVEYRFGNKRWQAVHTTPEATVVQSVAREMADAGATHLIMEASSHGLALGRLKGCRFDAVAFTNLTQDHLDFHKNMEEYGRAKLLLFTDYIAGQPGAKAVVNADDPFSAEILRRLDHPRLTFSVNSDSDADIRPVSEPRFSIGGIEADLIVSGATCSLSSRLLGQHNLSNLLTALGIAVQLGVEPDKACAGLSRVANVPGRLERVGTDEKVAVLVDYAHTPNALERALKALKPLTEGRLIAVFGCGGDRDTSKRALMGRAVAEGADVAVVTSDNPRTEDPSAIIDMILPGLKSAGLPETTLAGLRESKRGFVVEPDRATAIEAAVRIAAPKDTVLIAGKGHEDYQILGTEKIHFDDREQALKALNNLRGGADA